VPDVVVVMIAEILALCPRVVVVDLEGEHDAIMDCLVAFAETVADFAAIVVVPTMMVVIGLACEIHDVFFSMGCPI
jgi:hypothetical protein